MIRDRILIVAAHPDDEILGCAGTIAKLTKNGCVAHTLILGEGMTSRDEKRNRSMRESGIGKLKEQAMEANKIMGVKDVFMYDFPDNRFDSIALIDIVKVIEKIKKELKPDTIFTHYENDLNIDHRITYNAVITATRPLSHETVRGIYSFEVLSSTEWNYPHQFCPNAFFDVKDTLNNKIAAIKKYKSELKAFPHPRSTDGIRLRAEYWGMQIGLKYAEPFKIVRQIRK